MKVIHKILGVYRLAGFGKSIGTMVGDKLKASVSQREALRTLSWKGTQAEFSRTLELQTLEFGRPIVMLSEKHLSQSSRAISFTHFAELLPDGAKEAGYITQQVDDVTTLLGYRGFVNCDEFLTLEPTEITVGTQASQTDDMDQPEELPFLPDRFGENQIPVYRGMDCALPQVTQEVRAHLLVDFWKRLSDRNDAVSGVPMCLVLTSDAEQTIPSGIRFLAEELLPYLPTATHNTISYTMGVDVMETGNFSGSACYVGYSDYKSKPLVLYDFTRDIFAWSKQSKPTERFAEALGMELVSRRSREPLACMRAVGGIQDEAVRLRIFADYELTLCLFSLERLDEKEQELYFAFWYEAYRILTEKHGCNLQETLVILHTHTERFSGKVVQTNTFEEPKEEDLLLKVLASWPWSYRAEAAKLVWLYPSEEAAHQYLLRAAEMNSQREEQQLKPAVLGNLFTASWRIWSTRAEKCKDWITEYAVNLNEQPKAKQEYLLECIQNGSFKNPALINCRMAVIGKWLEDGGLAGEEEMPIAQDKARALWESMDVDPGLSAKKPELKELLTSTALHEEEFGDVRHLAWLQKLMEEECFEVPMIADAWVKGVGQYLGNVAMEAEEKLRIMPKIWQVIDMFPPLEGKRSDAQNCCTECLVQISTLQAEPMEVLYQHALKAESNPWFSFGGIAIGWIELLDKRWPNAAEVPDEIFAQLCTLLEQRQADGKLRKKIEDLYDCEDEADASGKRKQAQQLIVRKSTGMDQFILGDSHKSEGWSRVYSESIVTQTAKKLKKAKQYGEVEAVLAEYVQELEKVHIRIETNPAFTMELLQGNHVQIQEAALKLGSLRDVDAKYHSVADKQDVISKFLTDILQGVYAQKMVQMAESGLKKTNAEDSVDKWKLRIQAAVNMDILPQQALEDCNRLMEATAKGVREALLFQTTMYNDSSCVLFQKLWRRNGLAKVSQMQLQSEQGTVSFEECVVNALLFLRDEKGTIDWDKMNKALHIYQGRFSCDTLLKAGCIFRLLAEADSEQTKAFHDWLPIKGSGLKTAIARCFPAIASRNDEEADSYTITQEYLYWLKTVCEK